MKLPRAATGAAVVAVVLVAAAIFDLSRTRGGQVPETTATTSGTSVLTFDAPAGQAASIDPTTTLAARPSGPAVTTRGGTGSGAVTWKLTGSCLKFGPGFVCKVTVTASNHLQSGGFVDVFPSRGHSPACQQRGPLAHDSVVISGKCPTPFGSDVLAVYSVSLNVKAGALAQATLPWT